MEMTRDNVINGVVEVNDLVGTANLNTKLSEALERLETVKEMLGEVVFR